MASPQKENGFTPIANEILEQVVKLPLNGSQFSILITIWRYTYGYNRSKCEISQTFIAKATGISRSHISREINPLFEMEILKYIRKPTHGKSGVIAFNKDYDKWIINRRGSTESGTSGSTESGTSGSTESGTSGSTESGTSGSTESGTSGSTESGTQKRKKERSKESICGQGAPTHTVKPFVPPSIQEIEEYCTQRQNNIDAQKFLDFYESKGWMIGKNKMKNWKASVRTWESNSKNEKPTQKREPKKPEQTEEEKERIKRLRNQ